jgi:hypothetical protein
MKYEFTAEMENGEEFKATVDARDVRAWEAMFKQSFIKQDMSMTGITQLAYLALRRTKQLDQRFATYEMFDAQCVSIDSPLEPGTPEVSDVALLADPTPSSPTDDSYASSLTD